MDEQHGRRYVSNLSLVTDRTSVPVPMMAKQGKQRSHSIATEMAVSHGSSSSVFSSSPLSASTRPTQDEATALWEIMPTPSVVNNSPVTESNSECNSTSHVNSKRSHSFPSRSQQSSHPLVSPIGSPPNESMAMFNIPKIKNGPPYESTLPFESSSPFGVQPKPTKVRNVKRYPLRPRSRSESSKFREAHSNCIHRGLGPYFGTLPESIIYSIFGYIDYIDRHPTLMLISQGVTSILTRPEFLLQLKHAQNCNEAMLSHVLEENPSVSFNEILFVVGGKCPIKGGSNNRENVRIIRGAQARNGTRVHRRMTLQSSEHRGIMGYDMNRDVWLRFGGDPLAPFNRGVDEDHCSKCITSYANSYYARGNRHPLSPMNVADAKPIYVGHPFYCVMFFGGTHYETGMPSNRVIAFSFLTARWELWPEMMRARHGEDIIVARVQRENNPSFPSGLNDDSNPCNDCIVLIGCDLDFCDCNRCYSTSSAVETSDDVDMINFIGNDYVSFESGHDTASRASVDERRDHCYDNIGKCEVLDLTTRTWTRRESKAPSCPPDDGGVAVLEGRYVFLPGTCPPPPSAATWHQKNHRRYAAPVDVESEIVTPMLRSETSSQADGMQSDQNIEDGNGDCSSSSTMDVERENSEDELMVASLSHLFRSLHYRPGLVYDAWLDQWNTLPPRPYVTTSSPTTCSFRNPSTQEMVVLVLGGYRSSSENALSCYRHREEDSILDYEDHLDYAWWYTPGSLDSQLESKGECIGRSNEHNGKWTFGGGNSRMGHRQDFASSSDVAAAVAAASAMQVSSNCPDEWNRDSMYSHDSIDDGGAFPFGAPVSVRGATMTTYQGRLTMLGGLSTFSRTFYDTERETIWQFCAETCEWRRAAMKLPVPALLDGYAFSLHV